MKNHVLSDRHIAELFQNQPRHGTFQVMSILGAGLNYLDSLSRQRLNVLASTEMRTAAFHKQAEFACCLYRFLKEKTPLSLFDADYLPEARLYIAARRLFLESRGITFKQHRLSCMLDLIRLYRDDPCRILTGREALLAQLEKELLQEFLLLDMGWKNTSDLGKEAISNGYHECDYTLDIEEVWKQPVKSVPRQHFHYLLQSRSVSTAAACTLFYMKEHLSEMAPSLWAVDETAILAQLETGIVPSLSETDLAAIAATYQRI